MCIRDSPYLCAYFLYMTSETLFLLGFLLFIFFILALDLGLLNKKSDTVSMKQAGLMSFFVVALSMCFYFVLITYGHLLHGIAVSYTHLDVYKRQSSGNSTEKCHSANRFPTCWKQVITNFPTEILKTIPTKTHIFSPLRIFNQKKSENNNS